MTAVFGCTTVRPRPAAASSSRTAETVRTVTGLRSGAGGATVVAPGSSAPQSATAAASTPVSIAKPATLGTAERWIHSSSGEAGISAAVIAAAVGAQPTCGSTARASSAMPRIHGTVASASTAPFSRIGTSTPGTRVARAWKPAG